MKKMAILGSLVLFSSLSFADTSDEIYTWVRGCCADSSHNNRANSSFFIGAGVGNVRYDRDYKLVNNAAGILKDIGSDIHTDNSLSLKTGVLFNDSEKLTLDYTYVRADNGTNNGVDMDGFGIAYDHKFNIRHSRFHPLIGLAYDYYRYKEVGALGNIGVLDYDINVASLNIGFDFDLTQRLFVSMNYKFGVYTSGKDSTLTDFNQDTLSVDSSQLDKFDLWLGYKF